MTANACPPVSRRQARRQDRRDTILAVAQDYFLAHGYAGTSMSEIAAKLGGSKATLWSYFPSKEALFTASLEKATKAYQSRLSEILHPGGDMRNTLRRACISLMGKIYSTEAIALHRLIIAEGHRFPELSRIFFDLAPNSTQKLLADFLQAAMDDGQLRQADASEAAGVMIALVRSGTYQQLLMGRIDAPDQAKVEREADFIVDIVLRAYAPETTSAFPSGHNA
jgi:AcrR family transcriptional regulator